MASGRPPGPDPAPLPSGEIGFGRLTLSPARRTLHLDGIPVKLGSRAFDLLMLLAERAGEVVGKADLMERAWPDLTVEDIALRVQINAIRNAIGPDLRQAIEAIPGKGYRLTLPADAAAAPDGASDGAPGRSIIGRAAFIARFVDDLDRHTLNSLVGPGGIGKTTVAREVCRLRAARYADGVCLVDLATIRDAALVGETIARRLGLAVFFGSPLPGIVAHLRARQMLLLLETCEHVVDAVAGIVEHLLAEAPRIAVLATSREPLRAAGERVHRLPPLELPPAETSTTLADVPRYSALALFQDRMIAAGGVLVPQEIAAMAAICRRLDGLPMAIEIAAAHAARTGIATIAHQIDARFALAAPMQTAQAERHHTLQATLEWSYGLLTPPERQALRDLAIFQGRFTLSGAIAVIGSDPIANGPSVGRVGDLVDKSLISAPARGGNSYRLLDTTRDFARDALRQAGAYRQAAQRHAHFCLRELQDGAQATLGADAWRDRYVPLLEEVRAALDWSFAQDGDVRLGIALTTASLDLWTRLALFVEHRAIVERALLRLGPAGLLETPTELALQLAIGNILYHSGGMALDDRTDAAFRRALDLARCLGTQADRVRAVSGLVAQGISRGDYVATMHLEADLLDIEGALAQVANRSMAHNFVYMGKFAAAEAALARAMPDVETVSAAGSGVSYDHITVVETVRARLSWLTTKGSEAIRAAELAVQSASASGPPISLCLALATGALFVSTMTDRRDAIEHYLAMLEAQAARHSMTRWSEYACAYRLALIPRHVRTAAEADRFEAIIADANGALLESLAVLGDDRTTPRLIAKALESHAGWCRPELVRADIAHRLRAGSLTPAQAQAGLLQALAAARRQGMRPWELRIATSLMQILALSGRPDEGRKLLGPVIAAVTDRPGCPDLRKAQAMFSGSTVPAEAPAYKA